MFCAALSCIMAVFSFIFFSRSSRSSLCMHDVSYAIIYMMWRTHFAFLSRSRSASAALRALISGKTF